MNTTTQPSIKSLLDETKCKQYGDMSLAELAPRTLGQELVFFKLDRYVSENELEKEYEERGLIPAGVDSLCVHDSTDLDTKKYVGTHWKDGKGKWCFAAFRLWFGERRVHVDRHDVGVWVDYWWFAGFRKSALGTSETLASSVPLNLADLEKRVERLEKFVEAGQKIFEEFNHKT